MQYLFFGSKELSNFYKYISIFYIYRMFLKIVFLKGKKVKCLVQGPEFWISKLWISKFWTKLSKFWIQICKLSMKISKF